MHPQYAQSRRPHLHLMHSQKSAERSLYRTPSLDPAAVAAATEHLGLICSGWICLHRERSSGFARYDLYLYLQVVQHDRFISTTVHQPPPSLTGCHLLDPEVHMTWQWRGQARFSWMTVRDNTNTIYRQVTSKSKEEAATSHSVA